MNEAGVSLVTLLGLMAVLGLAEVAIPLHPARRQRWPTNLALAALFFLLNLLLMSGTVALAAAWSPHAPLSLSALPPVAGILLGIATLDFFTWLVHWLMHRSAWLWRFHRVHHSDELVDVTTTLRQHPLETVLRFAFTYGPAVALGASPLMVATYRLLSGINGLFEHANLRVPRGVDAALRTFWITPDFHKVHHSRDLPETDTNYGNLLSLYDRMFGTLTDDKPAAQVRYGLDDVPGDLGLGGLMRLPFRPEILGATHG